LSCAPRRQVQGAGRDVTCALSEEHYHRKVRPMSRFVAPLTFTVAAAWVVVIFVLVHGGR
jgi:hypothetical protein